MKAKELLAALSLPIEVAKQSMSSLPILGHIRLSAGTAAATNLQAAVEVGAPELDLGCCVHAGRLSGTLAAIAALSPDGEVKLSVKNGTLTVTAPNVKRTMPTLPAEDMPRPQWPTEEKSISDWNSQVAALRFAAHAAAVNNYERQYLNGIGINGEFVAASDGGRGALALGESQFAEKFIIPTQAIALICGIEGATAYSVSDTALVIHFPAGQFSVQLLAQSFPDVRRVFPTKHTELAVGIDREKLLRGLAAYGKTKTANHMRLSIEKGAAILEDETADGGTRIEVDCTYTGKPWTTGVPAPQLIDAAHALDGSSLTMSWAEGGSPVLLTGDTASRSIVIMPMRL